MEIHSPRIRSLLRQAGRVASNGKRAAAAKLYRQVIDEAPETAAAWVGLGGVLSNPLEKAEAYEKALALDPEDEAAQRALAALRGPKPEVTIDNPPEEVAPISPAVYEQSRDWLNEATAKRGLDAPIEQKAQQRETAEVEEEMDEPAGVTDAEPAIGHEHAGPHTPEVVESLEKVLYCTNHPGRETSLRCNRCGKPICSSCARPTPVGYRCPDCIREQEDVFFNATAFDYLLALMVSFPLSLFSGIIAGRIGFFVFFVGAAAGSIIGRVAFRAARRRRGRWLPHVVATTVVIGGILPGVPALLALLFGQPYFALNLLWLGIYVVVATGAAYYQLK